MTVRPRAAASRGSSSTTCSHGDAAGDRGRSRPIGPTSSRRCARSSSSTSRCPRRSTAGVTTAERAGLAVAVHAAACPVRRLPHDRAPRRRRHGRGLQAAGPEARSLRRGEGHAGRSQRSRTASPSSCARPGRWRSSRIRASSRSSSSGPTRIRRSSSWSTSTGFELGRVGPSLEFRQRARIVRDVCDAIHHAHALGIQHRDLKPSNIMLDGALSPKILDFGLSDGDPTRGHFRGTLHYIAPEQLDPSQPIDARTDVYALGVILYELLVRRRAVHGPRRRRASSRRSARGSRGCRSRSTLACRSRCRPSRSRPWSAGRPIATSRRARWRSISTRYLDGRPVLARPTQYASTLGARVRPHLEQIDEWLRLQADLSARGRAAARRRTGSSTRARTTGLSRAARCRTRRSRSTSARSCCLPAACSTSARIASTTRSTGVDAAVPRAGLPFIGLNARRAVAVPHASTRRSRSRSFSPA